MTAARYSRAASRVFSVIRRLTLPLCGVNPGAVPRFCPLLGGGRQLPPIMERGTTRFSPMRKFPALIGSILLTLPALPQVAAADPAAKMPPLTVRLLPGTEASVLENLTNVRLAKGAGPVTLQLDLAHKRILDAQGQTVVLADGHNPISLQGTVDKWRYVQALTRLAAAHPQDIHIDPHSVAPDQLTPPLPRIYNNGHVTYVVTNVAAPRQLVVFNLDANGGIQRLASTDSPKDSGDRVLINATVQPLFGVEHVVAVSAVDPARMQQFNAWLEETASAEGMLDTQGAILEQIAALKDVRVGMAIVYTCESASHCAR